ncbi:TIGR04282 family arsenosugar biosynthesis glycosyltransferase [Shivajiella indica]|uniref:TIGR04282 family arsenosugar biosynthesis glycosyltransferase n=1 Tax=Shivajiella indica TaxID=872115 RepID=A0ABW5BEE5_9BACT
MNQKAIIVFQKNLVLGKVKTRLADALGAQKALNIYKYLVDTTYRQLQPLTEIDIFIFFSDYLEDLPNNKFLKFIACQQKGNDLGERMLNAFIEVFSKGYKSVVIIGTDCPYLKTEILMDAFNCLKEKDVVFGPAYDGGYYLLGSNQVYPEIFKNIPWSTEKVLKISINTIESKKSTYSLLNWLSDIDTKEDWDNYLDTFEKK